MVPLTWRERLLNLGYDVCHPITTVQRTIAQRYCRRFDLVMVDTSDIVPMAAYRYIQSHRDAR
ncbi:hypothetical protein [Mycolicibacterium fortuitum]|uniref:hypothetical protein n=1 Tax=Mycolicibacterium fortuitum TaxID=1766 RepID=UPI001CDCB366|nr:hypothetical protein [Mycolicibacterium fortuitum]UBV14815.1 hypothetical protein H8Z57_29660 [Mycolicibacterium fortuitum]